MPDFKLPERAIDREASHKENADSDELKEVDHILEVDPKLEDRILRKCDCQKFLHCFAMTLY